MSSAFYPIPFGEEAYGHLYNAYSEINKAIKLTGIDDSQPDHAANDGGHEYRLRLAMQLIKESMGKAHQKCDVCEALVPDVEEIELVNHCPKCKEEYYTRQRRRSCHEF